MKTETERLEEIANNALILLIGLYERGGNQKAALRIAEALHELDIARGRAKE